MAKPATDLPFKCDVPGCGRAFGRVQGLGRHKVETHGMEPVSRHSRAKRDRASANGHRSELVASVMDDLAAIAAPLRARLASLDAEIDKHLSAVAELREARRVIVNGLKPFEPKTVGPARNGVELDAAKLNATRAYIVEHPELTEFTRDGLQKTLRAADVRPIPSSAKLVPIIEALRDEGLLRAGRVVKGGGLQYIVNHEGSDNGTA